MAPKRRGSSFGAPVTRGKRTARRPARIPSPSPSLDSSSSTQSLIPPSTSHQIDLLAGKVVTTGRKVDFEFLNEEGFSLGRQLTEMGWEKFCSMDLPTYPGLVKEFYVNLSRGDGGLVSQVRNTRIHVNSEILGNLLEIPVIGLSATSHSERGVALSRLLGREMTEFEEVSANQLPLELRLLHNICSRILFPKTGRFEYVSERDIVVMDCVVTGQPLNLPGMIIGYMAEAGSKKRATLPYGMILTKIFRSQGVSIMDNEPVKRLRHTDYYNAATLHRMGFKKVNGIWIKKGIDEVRGPRADSAVPGPSMVGPSSIHHSPDHYVPSDVPPSTPAVPAQTSTPSSSGFSETQLDQLKSLFSDQEAKFESRLLSMKESFYSLEDKVSRIESSLGDSSEALKCELISIFDKIKNIAGDSDTYSRSNLELQGKIQEAVELVQKSLNDFMKIQKDGMEKILDALRRRFGC